MAGTSDKYFTLQGFGVPVSAFRHGEKAGSQASSSNDCSSSIVGNLATGEYIVTGSKLSDNTTRTLKKSRQKSIKRTAGVSSEELQERKQKRSLYMKNYRAKQSKEAREARLQQMRQHAAEIRASESEQAREARLLQVRQHTAEIRASESEQAREARLLQVRQHAAEIRASESKQAREARLLQVRQHAAEIRASESQQAREARLQQTQQRNTEPRTLNRATMTGFRRTVNICFDKICEICTKRCYQHQISKWIVNIKMAPYLPDELKQKNCLVVCNRCKTHLTSKKNIAPSKSYWNNLDPGSILQVMLVE